VVLRSGSEWLDRRNLTSTAWWQTDDEVEVVTDRAVRLETLVGGWERIGVEFKRQVPGNLDRDSKLQLIKTVCAFANGDGGSVLIGVDDDDRSYIGVDPGAVDSLQHQLGEMVRTWVEPAPVTRFETLPIPDSERVILEFVVEPGATLYVCGQPGETRRAYVRHHSSTELASRGEILAIVNREAPVSIPQPLHLHG
jgi:predicted HTH transcriptional regulator